jgi:N-acetylglucosaminyl-diphospho-decaprenol L-rhamnosyltransferase
MAPEATAVIVDNGSQEKLTGIPDSWVKTISNGENRGFATATNQGFGATDAEFVLLLNPDVQLKTPLDRLVEACRRTGLSAGLLMDEDGKPQTGFSIRRLPTACTLIFELLGVNRLWPANHINSVYRCADLDLSKSSFVEQPAGAFLMVRRDVWEALGGLDERFYPVWFEDVDFCKRALDAGNRIEYVPEVTAIHAGGHSVRKITPRCQTGYWYDSLLKYAEKHFSPMQYKGVCLAAMLSSIPRAVLGMIRERGLAPISSWFDILAISGRRLVSQPRSVKGRVGVRHHNGL